VSMLQQQANKHKSNHSALAANPSQTEASTKQPTPPAQLMANHYLQRQRLYGNKMVGQMLQAQRPFNREAQIPKSTGDQVVQRVIYGKDAKTPITDIEEIKKNLGDNGIYKSIQQKVDQQKIDEVIQSFMDSAAPYYSVGFKRNQLLAQMNEILQPKQEEEQTPLLNKGDTVEVSGGILAKILLVDEDGYWIQNYRKIDSAEMTHHFDSPEHVKFSEAKKSDKEVSESTRKLEQVHLADPKVDFPKDKGPSPQQIVPKDLHFQPSAMHMAWSSTDGKRGIIYISQMAEVGQIEGHHVEVTIQKNEVALFKEMLPPHLLDVVNIHPIERTPDIWAEDNGEFDMTGGIRVPSDKIRGTEAEMAIKEDRKKRGYGQDHQDMHAIRQTPSRVGERDLQKDKVELAQSSNRKVSMAKSHIEGGNMLTGTLPDGRPYALIGNDSVAASKQALGSLDIPLEQVKQTISQDIGIPVETIFFIEQPGEFHLDVSMTLMGPGKVVLNDSMMAFNLQRQWVFEALKEDSSLQLQERDVEKVLSELEAEARIMAEYENRTASELSKLKPEGLEVIRIAGKFPGITEIKMKVMNFLNGEGGMGSDGKHFYVTNGGDVKAEKYFAQAVEEHALGVDRLYYIDPEASSRSLSDDGGMACRTKAESKPIG
jgi:hypothetical protein